MGRENPLNVLVVDDDIADSMIIEWALKKTALSNPVIFARDGVEALEIIRSRRSIDWPFLILLDINMPRMNGLQFLEELRKDAVFSKTVVFVLSTSEDERDINRAYDNYIAGYLLKKDLHLASPSLTVIVDKYSTAIQYPSEGATGSGGR